MRIRKRPADVLRHAQEAPVSSAQPCSAAAATAPAPCSETVAARRLEPPTGEVDLTTPGAAALDPRRVSSGQNRQKEGKEKGDGAAQDEKRGEDDGRAEREHKPPVNVVGSAPAQAPKREEEDRSTAVETEKKSGDFGRRVMEHGEEKISEAAALCKKGDGKGWHCKRAARCGYSLCQYHHDKLRSYACNSQKKKKKQQQQKKKPKDASATDHSTSAGVRHRQEAPQKENNNQKRSVVEGDVVLGAGPDMSPDSFYYYSGFGPRWGRKRRGGRSMEGGAPQVQLHQDDAGDGAAVAGREEDDGHGCDASSRDGKPWKSRALSSLL